MSSQEEDQVNEMEAMEAIYLIDFKIISSSAPRQFHVVIVPNADGQENHVSARLEVEYPPTYPTVSPSIVVRAVLGLTNEHVSALSSIVQSTMASCVGDVCVFNVCEAVKEWLLDHNKPQLSMFDQMEERRVVQERERELAARIEAERLAAQEEAENARNRKFKDPSPLGIEPGTLVTPESFAMWKALFDAEQARLREERERNKPKSDGRLTGKQMFLQNLAQDVLDDEADGMVEESVGGADAGADAAGAAGAAGGKVFWYQEGLFADDDVDVEAIRAAARADLELSDDEEEEEDGEDGEDGNDKKRTDAAKSKSGASPKSSSAASTPATATTTAPAAAASSTSSKGPVVVVKAVAPAASPSPSSSTAAAATATASKTVNKAPASSATAFSAASKAKPAAPSASSSKAPPPAAASASKSAPGAKKK